jgi:hypothetical protein
MAVHAGLQLILVVGGRRVVALLPTLASRPELFTRLGQPDDVQGSLIDREWGSRVWSPWLVVGRLRRAIGGRLVSLELVSLELVSLEPAKVGSVHLILVHLTYDARSPAVRTHRR